jgi:primosomal protein N' (replication factor Y)
LELGDEPAAPSAIETTRPEGRVVRVLPDVVGIDRAFDYVVPTSWEADGRAERVVVGSMVRVPLAGRRVDGWVTAIEVEPEPGVRLVELVKLRGAGPSPELLDLAGWAAWRWAGRRVAFLRAASPERMVAAAAKRRPRDPVPAGPRDVFDDAFDHGIATVRVAPDDDGLGVALAACRRGDALILTADAARARHLAVALRRAGVSVALAPDEWAAAAGGATVVGTRSAAWMPMPDLAAVVVIDEHDERFKEERTPAWHAREVALERARRAGVPAVMTSAVPSLEALRVGPLLRRDRSIERDDWPIVDVLDRRDEDPAKSGPFATDLRRHIDGDRRVVCVLNRTGRARLLACEACGELVRSDDGVQIMRLVDDELVSADGSERRPVICTACGSTALKTLRVGVERAREELEAFLGEPVDEITAASEERPQRRVAIGTEAVLHRVDQADVVVFLDFDQELLAVRQRAAEQAMAMIAQAARLVGGRGRGGRIVVQTRQPEHEVILAAGRGDPSLVAVAERDRRRPLRLPPYGAQVSVSGEGGAALIDSFGTVAGVQVRGPLDGRWLLRAESQNLILDRLAEVERPAARVRIDVDPLRV